MIVNLAHSIRRHRLSTADTRLSENLAAAVSWILQACAQYGVEGIYKGYDLLRNQWSPPYPETTGYTIPTLLNVAVLTNHPELVGLAIRLADYLIRVATPEGGVGHWKQSSDSSPIVFDTGQVIFGWLAAYRSNQDDRYLQAAIKAGNWLVKVQEADGKWKYNQYLGVEKVIDTRVAWALLELFQQIGGNQYLDAAQRNLDWALEQQDTDGWFNHCAFTLGKDPITHTLAYSAEGLFKCGQILNDTRYSNAAKLTAEALLAKQRSDGSLAASYSMGWRASSRYSCLTGNCQISSLWLQFYKQSGDRKFLEAAKKAIYFVASTQDIETNNLNIRGAIAGSYPFYGGYERFKYPNWATKFFIDALMALELVETRNDNLMYPG